MSVTSGSYLSFWDTFSQELWKNKDEWDNNCTNREFRTLFSRFIWDWPTEISSWCEQSLCVFTTGISPAQIRKRHFSGRISKTCEILECLPKTLVRNRNPFSRSWTCEPVWFGPRSQGHEILKLLSILVRHWCHYWCNVVASGHTLWWQWTVERPNVALRHHPITIVYIVWSVSVFSLTFWAECDKVGTALWSRVHVVVIDPPP